MTKLRSNRRSDSKCPLGGRLKHSDQPLLIRTTFDSEYVINESFIDDLRAKRRHKVDICEDSDTCQREKSFPQLRLHITGSSHLCR